jgi:TetR/AcrR family tetracycline transcriptional repressor
MPDQPSRTRTRPGRAWVGAEPDGDEPRRVPLSRPRVVRAALQLVDEKGLAALTMRGLATELGVSPMALYNHVHDKEELVDLMLDLMLEEVDLSPVRGDWCAQLRALVLSYHCALAAHPQLARVYSSQIALGPHGLAVIERTLALLLQGGLTPEDATHAFYALYTYTVGFHQMGGTDPHEYAALPPDRIPSIIAVREHLGVVRRRAGFEFGLDALLDGIRTHAPSGRSAIA